MNFRNFLSIKKNESSQPDVTRIKTNKRKKTRRHQTNKQKKKKKKDDWRAKEINNNNNSNNNIYYDVDQRSILKHSIVITSIQLNGWCYVKLLYFICLTLT